jgi:hypothetical protein
MAIGMTWDEFNELRANDELFPMTRKRASEHLRTRGYDCRPESLDLLTQNGVVTPLSRESWNPNDINLVAAYFEEHELFTPYAAMCQTLSCSYADFVRPLRDAARLASEQYSRHVPASDQYFVMHRVPPRYVTDKNERIVSIQPSVITFSLRNDVREQLELGEEV